MQRTSLSLSLSFDPCVRERHRSDGVAMTHRAGIKTERVGRTSKTINTGEKRAAETERVRRTGPAHRAPGCMRRKRQHIVYEFGVSGAPADSTQYNMKEEVHDQSFFFPSASDNKWETRCRQEVNEEVKKKGSVKPTREFCVRLRLSVA